MKTLKILGNCSLVFLAVVGILLSIAFGYYHFFVHEETVGVNYIDDQIGLDIVPTEDLTQEEIDIYEERWFMEANYYSNSKNNGIELQELRFNYFTNYQLLSTGYRSTGMQYLGDYHHSDVTVSSDSERDNYVFKAFNYYDTTDGISYSGYAGKSASVSTVLKRSTSFTIKIDNRAFEIKLDKYWSKKHGWWIFGYTEYHYFTYSELFESVFKAIKSNSAGYGDYYITLDLSDFFTIYEYTSNGKVKADNVTDIIKNYAVLKFHYDENGARNSTQSIFKCIDCNPSYDVEDLNIDTTYWQERMLYTLTNKDLKLRYSEVYDGYFISLSQDTKTLFENMPRAKVNVTINTSYENKNVIGIDYNGFEQFEIDTLTISGSGPQTFYILSKGLFETHTQTIKRSAGILLDMASDSINTEYSEVVV